MFPTTQNQRVAVRKSRGQTFPEMMIVVAIIAILAAVIIANLFHARGQAQVSASVETMRGVSSALEMYYNDQGAYPAGSAVAVNPALFGGSTNVYYGAAPLSPNGRGAFTFTYHAGGSPWYYFKDPGTYDGSLLANYSAGTDGSDTVTAPPSTCTHIHYNPDVGPYCT